MPIGRYVQSTLEAYRGVMGGSMEPFPFPRPSPSVADYWPGTYDDLEALYGAIKESAGSFAAHDDPRYVDVGDPPLPLEDWLFEGEGAGTWIRQVLPGPVGGGITKVPFPSSGRGDQTPTVVQTRQEQQPYHIPPHEVSENQDVEEFPQGDWPAGSIFAPGEVWGPEEWDPDREPDPVEEWISVQPHDLDTAPTIEEEDDMAHDWGHLGRQFLEGLGGFGEGAVMGQQLVGGPSTGTGPTQIPSGRGALTPTGQFRVDQYGRLVRCRRRRRRLLTNSDLKDLAALKTITGNNDALKMAVIKAVR